MTQKRITGHGDAITPWRVSSNQESDYKSNVPINATLIGAAGTAINTVFVIIGSLFSDSDTIVKVNHIFWLVARVVQMPLVLAFTIKHHKKTSKINPVVPKTLQFYEDGHDCDDISNNGNDEATENDGHQIVTRVEVYDYVGSIDKADENSVKSDENCQYLELSISNVKLTEIGEAFGQLPGEVCHI